MFGDCWYKVNLNIGDHSTKLFVMQMSKSLFKVELPNIFSEKNRTINFGYNDTDLAWTSDSAIVDGQMIEA